MDSFAEADATAGAALYILHGLLQRLERTRPGLVEGMLEGVRLDREDMEKVGGNIGIAAAISLQAERALALIHAQNQMTGPDDSRSNRTSP